MAAGGPGPETGWTGDVFSLVRTPVPPRIVLHAANVLRATKIRTWGHAAATVRWHSPEDGAAQLAQEGPHPYQDLPGGFSRHLQHALLRPWIIGRGSMTAWEARIVREEWAREWGR